MADMEIYSNDSESRDHSIWILHWMCYAFFALCMASALWQHAHPYFTLWILGLVIPAGLVAYIPEKTLDDLYRTLLQMLVLTGAFIWGLYRLSKQVPPDKFLVECLCIAGLSFSFTSRKNRYNYTLLISIVLVMYGAVFPRSAYLHIIPFAALIGILLAYWTRPLSLARNFNVKIPSGIFRKNWPYLFLHLLLAMTVGAYIYSILPTKGRKGVGIIRTSFLNENEDYLPPQFNNWFKSPQRISQKGKEIISSEQGKLGKQGKKVSSLEEQNSLNASGNGGSGPPGKDLLFRIKSPIKLYWLCRLYDEYDGIKWLSSKKMNQQIPQWDFRFWRYTQILKQKVIVDKWMSPSLPAAFLATNFVLPRALKKDTVAFYSERLSGENDLPETPFSYSVFSRLCKSKGADESKRGIFWFEKIKPKHYVQIPEEKIKGRVKELVKKICTGVKGDYEKAIAIRDYLRNNYSYKMDSKPVPQGREAVDFFLFNLKEGHCEYFASAMTVMARIAGLPARVATGFSPGNLNTMTGYFEVYEYHAHAWSQVFIPTKGWLTFDATPPGEIISRTSPLLVGSHQDPFGDEWRITPPEITEYVKKFMKPLDSREQLKEIAREQANLKDDALMNVLMKIPVTREEFVETIEELKDAALSKEDKDNNKVKRWNFASLIATVKSNIKLTFRQIVDSIKDFFLWLFGMNGMVLGALTIFMFVIWHIGSIIAGIIHKYRTFRRCMKLQKSAAAKVQDNPIESISLCYHMIREMLNLAGWPRENNMDLFDYGASLRYLHRPVRDDILVIFFLYSQDEYSRIAPSVQDAGKVLEKTENIKEALLEFI